MELEELRQRLLLRSRSSDIPPIAHPVQIPEVAFSQAASKLKWETALTPAEIAARLRINGAKAETSSANPANGNASRAENAPAAASTSGNEATTQPSTDIASSGSTSPVTEPIALLADTVDLLCEPTAALREHFAQLDKLLEPIDTATQSTEEALKRIAGLFEHLSRIANNVQSVKAFAEQVKTLSASFEPMRGMNAQLDLVMQALYANVKAVAAALAPVKTFQGKVRRLLTALDSIDKLEGQISGLADAFRPASEKPAQPQSVPTKPAQVAQAA